MEQQEEPAREDNIQKSPELLNRKTARGVKLQNEILTTPLFDLSSEALKYTTTPLGQVALRKSRAGEPNKKISNRETCIDCGKTYPTINRSRHIKTKHHRMYAEMNQKFLAMLHNRPELASAPLSRSRHIEAPSVEENLEEEED